MALDRQSIEKRDFPVVRRGYDPQAVDAHLAEIADQVQQLRLAARGQTESVAAAASEQVRAIVEAAEASAGKILRRAETEARERVERVSEATAVMLARLNAMNSELSSLLDGLEGVRAAVAPASEPQPAAADPLIGNGAEAPAAEAAEPAQRVDTEGARLVALNMALDGRPRDETERYLSENFVLPDRQQLLDEVYASVAD